MYRAQKSPTHSILWCYFSPRPTLCLGPAHNSIETISQDNLGLWSWVNIDFFSRGLYHHLGIRCQPRKLRFREGGVQDWSLAVAGRQRNLYLCICTCWGGGLLFQAALDGVCPAYPFLCHQLYLWAPDSSTSNQNARLGALGCSQVLSSWVSPSLDPRKVSLVSSSSSSVL